MDEVLLKTILLDNFDDNIINNKFIDNNILQFLTDDSIIYTALFKNGRYFNKLIIELEKLKKENLIHQILQLNEKHTVEFIQYIIHHKKKLYLLQLCPIDILNSNIELLFEFDTLKFFSRYSKHAKQFLNFILGKYMEHNKYNKILIKKQMIDMINVQNNILLLHNHIIIDIKLKISILNSIANINVNILSKLKDLIIHLDNNKFISCYEFISKIEYDEYIPSISNGIDNNNITKNLEFIIDKDKYFMIYLYSHLQYDPLIIKILNNHNFNEEIFILTIKNIITNKEYDKLKYIHVNTITSDILLTGMNDEYRNLINKYYENKINKCTICTIHKIDQISIVCGHVFCCHICSSKLTMCPYCRTETAFTKIHILQYEDDN
ncbi:RING zinc finger-containing protein [Alphaentomopoxvirus acuprea]|uniref:RING zinc finger-containing protein n=1 Tax=Alphaentomopoxvirus acuprea TaxID=62099 RepID=W6JIZ3_9POXV|nr:RING zinc finger-containing protein [Anomala cuprea entomopoxvirus]BAO49542.1 RING zinc finger-containing protein [Anomala cuprea entomopoxvirus]